jgi:hypothetical protein
MNVGMILHDPSQKQRFVAQPGGDFVHRLYAMSGHGMVVASAQVPSFTRADGDKTCYPSPLMRSGRQLSRSHFFAETRRFVAAHAALTRRAFAFGVLPAQRGKSTGEHNHGVRAPNSSPSFSRPPLAWPVASPVISNAQAPVPSSAASPRPRSTATWRQVSPWGPQVARFATTSTSADHQLIRGAARAMRPILKDRPGVMAPAVLLRFRHVRGARAPWPKRRDSSHVQENPDRQPGRDRLPRHQDRAQDGHQDGCGLFRCRPHVRCMCAWPTRRCILARRRPPRAIS